MNVSLVTEGVDWIKLSRTEVIKTERLAAMTSLFSE